MRKYLSILGIDGNLGIEVYNKTFIDDLTVNGGTLKAFYLNFGTR